MSKASCAEIMIKGCKFKALRKIGKLKCSACHERGWGVVFGSVTESLRCFFFRSVMRNVESIQELFTLSQERLATILGNAGSAKQLWEFIHNDNKTQTSKVQTTTQRNRR